MNENRDSVLVNSSIYKERWYLYRGHRSWSRRSELDHHNFYHYKLILANCCHNNCCNHSSSLQIR